MRTYPKILLALFAAVWIWAAISPLYRADWILENVLVLVFVPVIYAAGRRFGLSDLAWTSITGFLVLHLVGSHYTYSEVPFGFTLQRWLGSDRNMYDRLVHFSFGFLLAVPVRELFVSLTGVRGFWSYYLPLDVTLSFSAVYEILEWWAAASLHPEAGIAFLGTQGDVWDAQKDMALAGTGALLAMIAAATLRTRGRDAGVRATT